MADRRKQTPDVLAEILGGESGRDLPSGASAAVGGKAEAWEYQVVTFQDYKGWRPRYCNGQELDDWTSGPPIHEYLARKAAEGWELAAASAGEPMYGKADSHQLYFRRRR